MSSEPLHEYEFDRSPERIENAFDELYFALAASGEEQEYVRDRVYEHVEPLVIRTVRQLEDDSSKLDDGEILESADNMLDQVAHLEAALFAQNTGYSIKAGIINREEFYELDVEERFRRAKEVNDRWDWKERPEVSLD